MTVRSMTYDFRDYTEMRQRVGQLFQDGNLSEAALVLEWGLTRFSDNLLANAYNLATCCALLEQPEKSVQALQYGLDHDVWYGTWDFTADFWDPVKDLDAFQAIQSRSEAFRQQAQQQAQPELTVVTPASYNPEKAYPLFIALHGGGETVADFKPHWISPRLGSEFIIAYPQSSRVVSMRGFSWIGDDQDRQEIAEATQKILKDFQVDTNQILIGGFSAGGHLALTLLLDEIQRIPLRGFVVLCPPVPEDYSQEAVLRIAARGQRGTLLTTEMDNRVKDQCTLASAFESGGVPLIFEITPNIGHWYPLDMAGKIDQAVDFIMKS